MNNCKRILKTGLLIAFGLISSARADDISTNTARMQAMDKITGEVTEIDVPVGGLANYGSFSILVRKCVTRSPEEAPESTAFVDVVDNYDGDNPVNIFKGWMFASSPALSAVEHPIYDVWLLKCYNHPQNKEHLLSPEKLALRDELPMQRMDKVKVNIGEIGDMTDVASQDDAQREIRNDDTTVQDDVSEDIDFASEGEENEDSETRKEFSADITIGSVNNDLVITDNNSQNENKANE